MTNEVYFKNATPAKRAFVQFVVILLVAIAGFQLSTAAQTGGTGQARYYFADFIRPSAASGWVAFRADREQGGSSVLVVSGSGKVEASSAEIAPGAIGDFPWAWFPGGKRLLITRVLPSPDGGDECMADTLVLWVSEERTESLSQGKGGLGNGNTAAIAGDEAVILYADADYLGSPGLYLYRKVGDQWMPRLLLADSPHRRWRRCLWARADEDRYRMVASSIEDRGGDSVIAFWQVEIPAAGTPRLEPAASFYEELDGEDASPDGSLLAVLRERSGIPFQGRLALVPLGATGQAAASIRCGKEVSDVCFSPEGRQLLLWSAGGLQRPIDGFRAEILILDVNMRKLAHVHIPEPPRGGHGAFLSDVAWLSEDVLAMSFINCGIVKLDLATGAVDMLWRVARSE